VRKDSDKRTDALQVTQQRSSQQAMTSIRVGRIATLFQEALEVEEVKSDIDY